MSENASTTGAEAARIIETLVSHSVEFVVCGGVACMLQGVPGRLTTDVDLHVRLTDANLDRFVQAARVLQVQSRSPEPLEAIANPARRAAWIKEKQAVVSTYSPKGMTLQIDVFLRYPIPFDELSGSADKMCYGGVEFLVSSKQHLIRAKQQVIPPRTIDQRDIADLQELLAHERSSDK